MESIVISLISGMIMKEKEIRNYSLDITTSFNMNRKLDNSKYLQNVTIIQLLAIFAIWILPFQPVSILLSLFAFYHILLFRAEWFDWYNAKNVCPGTVGTLLEYGVSALIAIAEMISGIVFIFIGMGRMNILYLQVLFYLLQFLCFCIAQKKILRGIDKNKIREIKTIDFPFIIIKEENNQSKYPLNEYFLFCKNKQCIVFSRSYKTIDIADMKKKKCFVGLIEICKAGD